MKQLKILDTVSSFGNAEKYIFLDMNFQKFMRREFGLQQIKNIDPIKIAKKYHLRGFVFGNYVTQEERYFFLYKITKQLELLASLKGKNNLGKDILIVAFGSQGRSKANAHYNPSEQLINLSRGRKSNFKEILKGESSFVHEYGHFIDFTTGRSDESVGVNFCSELATDPSGKPKTKLIAETTRILIEDEDYMSKISHSLYLKKEYEIFARLFEATITHHVFQTTHPLRNYLDRGYNSENYYPEIKIIQENLDKKILKILKNF